jgi:hypothetical protein
VTGAACLGASLPKGCALCSCHCNEVHQALLRSKAVTGYKKASYKHGAKRHSRALEERQQSAPRIMLVNKSLVRSAERHVVSVHSCATSAGQNTMRRDLRASQRGQGLFPLRAK